MEKLYENALEEYPRSSAVIGNLAMLLWISLGTVACWFFSPLIAGIYLTQKAFARTVITATSNSA